MRFKKATQDFPVHLIFTIAVYLFFTACDEKEKLLSEGGFPDKPVNLVMFNSKYNDYNSALAPGEYDMFTLIFSSDRNSGGDDFDLNLFPIYISYPFDEDIVTLGESGGITMVHSELRQKIDIINTSANQFGPYFYQLPESQDIHKGEFLIFYAEGEPDHLDLKFWIHELVEDPDPTHRYEWAGPFNLTTINTMDHSEGYISLQGNRLYYCSNEPGHYDICEKDLPSNNSFVQSLRQDSEGASIQVDRLNSPENDKCPYVVDSLIVFTSDRKGGYGGYDLYYSEKINGEWGEPQNFGSPVNSEFDEYRPILMKYEGIPNDLLIFSSDRPGGEGGFDLYYVGVFRDSY